MMHDFSAAKDEKQRSHPLSSSSSSSSIIPTTSKIIVQYISELLSSDDDNNSNDNKKIINQLDLPDGLKDLLIKHDMSLESILNTSPADIATTLRIDQHVAELICAAAKKQSKMLERMR